jgi:hypothetical protein
MNYDFQKIINRSLEIKENFLNTVNEQLKNNPNSQILKGYKELMERQIKEMKNGK